MSGNGRTKKPAGKKKSTTNKTQTKHKARKPITISLRIAKKK